MTRKLKALWLVLIAVLALGAAGASGVLAEEEGEGEGLPKRFVFGAKPVIVTGSNGGVEITSAAGEIVCTAHYQSTLTEDVVTEISVTPTYTKCNAFGYADTDVSFEGCTYLFTLEAGLYFETGGKTSHTHGPMHIKCPAGKTIVIKPTESGVAVCTIKIYGQLPEGVVDQKNTDKGKLNERDVLFTSTVKGIGWEVEGGGGKCGQTGKTEKAATLEGAITLKAFKDESGFPGTQVSFRIYGTEAP
jgi:hypothetical protein